MKKVISLLLLTAIITIFMIPSFAYETNGANSTNIKAGIKSIGGSAAPVADGIISAQDGYGEISVTPDDMFYYADTKEYLDIIRTYSFKIYAAYSANTLYIAVKADTPNYIQKQAADEMWKQYSLQVSCAKGDESNGITRSEYGFARNSDTGAFLFNAWADGYGYNWNPTGGSDYNISTVNGQTVYEAAIPAGAFGVNSFNRGDKIRLNVCLNVSDTVIGQIEWSQGCARSKNSGTFAVVTLSEVPVITVNSMFDGNIGKEYSQKLTASSYTPVTWMISAGSLPAGLSIVGDTIKGVPMYSGSWTFTVKASNADGLSATKQFTIMVLLSMIMGQNIVPVTGVTLNVSVLNLSIGNTYRLICSVQPANAADKSVTWASDSNGVATVDQNGLLTAVSSGTAVITVRTAWGGYKASCTVKVAAPVTPSPASVTKPSVNTIFGDVGALNGKYSEYIQFVYDKKLLSGVSENRFGVEISVTRAMCVTIFGRIANISTDKYKSGAFSDVAEDSAYAPYIGWAAANGIVSGYEDGSFRPEAKLNREQLAVMIYNFAKYLDKVKNVNSGAGSLYSDNSSISGWASDAVKFCKSNGIMTVFGSARFDPKVEVSRAEISTVIYYLYINLL